MNSIYIIHENEEWTRHLTKRLEELELPYKEWHMRDGIVDLTSEPPEGIFYNRMSASSHTRGHRYAPELAAGVLDWLEQHGRKVFNGPKALSFEISKIKQYTALTKAGIKTPATIAATGKANIIEAAKKLGKKQCLCHFFFAKIVRIRSGSEFISRQIYSICTAV